MSEVNLKLLPVERELLVRMLIAAVNEKRVEVRRTEFSPRYATRIRSRRNTN